MGKNSKIPLFFEIISVLPLFEKYLVIYHFLKLKFVKLDFDMELVLTKIEYLKKVHLELKFMKLEFLVMPLFEHFHYLLTVSYDGADIH